uniref:Uncharacterized protein n=1 Tax=Anguilla anguilla TaxID=7936 RepID=A0A0E9P7E2_ANGAN
MDESELVRKLEFEDSILLTAFGRCKVEEEYLGG